MNSEIIFNTMEVLETKPLNELVTEAIIKVCYVSELPNRNGTVITKEVGKEIAATLPGAPVVGLFNKDTQDFVEHSRKITISNGEVHLEDLTKPYGFVGFDQPWYQDFIEDGVSRTYLMCKAYLWTKQYPEAEMALNKGQSMELNESELTGYYEGDVFVFTHATIDKLCILGNKYEPCFEGARIMTTYAKAFNTLAENVEDILGRRYFVHKGQLVPKMEKNTIKYALELGGSLHTAIYNQLHERGCDNYYIQGIYADTTSSLYAILQDMETMAFVRVIVAIKEDDTVELSPDMKEVVMNWVDKTPIDESKVTPIKENPEVIITSREPAHSIAAPRIKEMEAEFALKEQEYTAKIAELEEQISQFNANEPEAKITELEGQISEYTAQIADLQAQITQFTDNSNEPVATPDVTEYTVKIETLESQVTELENQLNVYKAAEKEAEKHMKQSMIDSYKIMLNDDEIAPIIERIDEYSLEQVEEKLSVLYARKSMKANEAPVAQFQLNVNVGANSSLNEEIPEFMSRAIEYDKLHQI